MPRITVAELSQTVSQQGEALNSIMAMLEALTETTSPSNDEVVIHPKGETGFVPVPKEEAVAKAEPKAVTDNVVVVLERQADKSQGGKLRFWAKGGDSEAGGSVYIGGADIAAKQLTLTVCEAEAGQATLRVEKAKSGRRRQAKARHTFGGTFKYGEAVVQIFTTIPKEVAKDFPDEVGFTLDGLTS